jgi:hypothetical protein
MPQISTFFGIIIRMHFHEHPPPHFHAEHRGEQATFDLDGQLLQGKISSRTARKLIAEWAQLNRRELVVNWNRIERGLPLNRIAPLD